MDSVAYLQSIGERTLKAASRYCETPHWALRLTILSTAAALFFAFPSYEDVNFSSGRLRGFAQQVESITGYWHAHPVHDNLIFRLTMPVLAHTLHLGVIGCFAVQFAAGILLFYLLARLLERATHDRCVALLVCLGVAGTWGGVTSFVELRGIFDGVAIFLVLAAMYVRQPVGIAVLIFAASFTDERAILAAGFAYLWWVLESDPSRLRRAGSWFNPRSLSVAAGVAGHLVLRYYLSQRFGLHTEGSAQLLSGNAIFVSQINNFPLGVWTGLEGLWVLVCLSLLSLKGISKPLLVAYVGLVLVIAFAAGSVVDITRSMAYLLPAVPVAIASLRSDRNLRWVSLVAASVCLACPTWYAGGTNSVWWQYPLPVQLIRRVVGHHSGPAKVHRVSETPSYLPAQ